MSDGKYMIIRSRSELHKIMYSDIYYFERGNGDQEVGVVSVDGLFKFRGSIQKILPLLDDRFELCYRGIVANVSRIKSIKTVNEFTTLYFNRNNEEEISCPCSDKYRSEVQKKWES